MCETPWYETVSFPALLRGARATYSKAMRAALQQAGYDDIPGNGLYLIGGLALGRADVPLGALISELNVSKQTASQLVDTLVLRGYLERAPHPEDRRQLMISLTERGKAAAAVQAAARAAVDDRLMEAAGSENVSRTRRTLAQLAAFGREDEGDTG